MTKVRPLNDKLSTINFLHLRRYLPSAAKILWRFLVIDSRNKRYIQHARSILIGKDNHEPARWIHKRVVARRDVNDSAISGAQPKRLARVYCFTHCAGRHTNVMIHNALTDVNCHRNLYSLTTDCTDDSDDSDKLKQ